MKLSLYKSFLKVDKYLEVQETEEKYINRFGKIEIKSPLDVYRFFLSVYNIEELPTEHVWVLCVDTKLQVVQLVEVSEGTVNSSIAHSRDIFKSVILSNCTGFFLIHNHPSGDCTPSGADRDLYDGVKKAAKIMSFRFFDSIIISPFEVYTMDKELRFKREEITAL